jgi:hypothetical protein
VRGVGEGVGSGFAALMVTHWMLGKILWSVRRLLFSEWREIQGIGQQAATLLQ